MLHCSMVSSQTRSVSTTTAVEIEPRISTSMTPAIARRVSARDVRLHWRGRQRLRRHAECVQAWRLVILVNLEIERELFGQRRLERVVERAPPCAPRAARGEPQEE